jgi:ornithine cyclodeaminase
MTTQIYNLDQIKSVLKDLDSIQFIEDGFVAYSQGKTIVPPVGESSFSKIHPETCTSSMVLFPVMNIL